MFHLLAGCTKGWDIKAETYEVWSLVVMRASGRSVGMIVPKDPTADASVGALCGHNDISGSHITNRGTRSVPRDAVGKVRQVDVLCIHRINHQGYI